MIQTRDEIGNRVNISQSLLLFLFKMNDVSKTQAICQFDPARKLPSTFQTISESNASASIFFSYNLTGLLVIQGILLQPGGLSAQVFDSPFIDEFSILRGSLTSVYSFVDMNFGSALIEIDFPDFYSSTTTMIVWRGFLVPLFTESYTFQLSSNGCTNVNISGKMLFSCSKVTMNTLILRANELHPVEVSFLPSNGQPYMMLFWQSFSQKREIIPSSRW